MCTRLKVGQCCQNVRGEIRKFAIIEAVGEKQICGDRFVICAVPLDGYRRCIKMGDYWLILETDADNTVDEGVAETNNIRVADTPTSIVIPPTPDLQVTAIAISGDAWSGRQILVDWTVENQGDADATGRWVDSIYLSADDQVGDDVPLGTFGREGDVPIGASYILSRPVLLPHGIEADHWLVVVTNESELLYEADATDNNALVSDVSIPVQMLPAPDLQVSTVEIPDSAVGGGDLSVSWTVTNLGDGATDVPFWYDQAYLSSDDVLDGNDTVLGRVFNASYLEPDGESYGQEAEFSMSPETAGVFYVIVQTDSRNSLSEYNSTEEAEDNNWSISTSQIAIELMPTPDLQITQVDVSATEPRSGLTIDVTWEAVNRGELQIEGQTWTDQIYLSTDELFSNDDLILDTFTQNSPFEVNTPSTRTQTVTLPLERFGEHHIIVVTDTGNQIFELFREDNNSEVSQVIDIKLTPPGDLQVDSVETVAIASAGDEVVVSWTVINNGGGDTNRDSWTDSVYFSQDETLEIGTDTFLGRFTHTGTLAADASYREERTVRLPRAVSGDYHLIVLTDSGGDVFEFQWEDNNTNNTSPMQVQIANLQITQATSPESGAAGNFVLLEWTVKNVGEGTTDASSWRDTIYLSQDETLDTTSDNTLLATFDHSNRLTSGEEVVNAQNVVLPKGLDGEFFLFIQADSNGAVFESDETDNLRSALTSIDGEEPVVFDVRLENEPDLLPVSVRRPKRATAGQSVLLSWTIANEGIHSTGALPWQDAIYLSIDRTLDATDILLGTFLVDVPDIPVEPQAMYNRAESLRIPLGTEAGKYFVLVHTDLNNDVVELNAEGNNVKSSGSALSIKPNNPDDPDALIATPDLLVTEVNAPPTGSAGKPLELSWVVTNVGNVPNVVSRWVDAVYLSSDSELSLDTDTRLGGFIHYGSLNPEEFYTLTVTVTIPQGISGEHALFIVTDAENDEFEFEREENNLDTAPTMLLIDLAPTDLQVMDVVLPETGMSGQEIEVGWTVENRGTGDTNSSRWYDNIYFSRDTFIDDTDVKLGFSLRNAPLPPNENYSSTTPIQLPKGFAGPAYIIITTDANNQVYEHDSEDNNTTVSPQIQVMLTPPTDLVVSKIELPQVAVSGQSAEIRWTVTNQGDVDALGRWFDSVFLSTDSVWDIDDAFVGDVQNPAPLAPNASYTGNINTTLPGVLPGDYFVIIRTDIRDQVSEVDNLNNDADSGNLLPIEVAELTLSEATQSQLSTGTEHYYKVSVPAGEDLLITLDSASELSTNELYVRYGAIPSVREHDFRFDALFQADQQITVPTTQAGTYYILVRGEDVPEGSAAYAIRAELLMFEVRSVNPNRGGNVGNVTIEINGAQFRESMSARLVSPSGDAVETTKVYFNDSTSVFATFDLAGRETGVYDVHLENPNGGIGTLTDGFEIISGIGAQLFTQLITPQSVRADREAVVWLEYENVGDTDMAAPLLIVRSNTPLEIYDNIVDIEDSNNRGVLLLGISDDRLAGVLRPGARNRIPLFSLAGRGGTTIELEVSAVLPDIDTPVDWSFLQTSTRPDWIDPFIWAELPTRFPERFGNTWADFLDFMSNEATRLSLSGIWIHDFDFYYVSQAIDTNTDFVNLSQTFTQNLNRTIANRANQQDFSTLLEIFKNTVPQALPPLVSALTSLALAGPDFYINGAIAALHVKRISLLGGPPSSLEDRVEAGFAIDRAIVKLQRELERRGRKGDLEQPDSDDVADDRDDKGIPVVGSFDPNDKLVSVGIGEEGFISPEETLPYTIRFENVADATAPAEQVVVTDLLIENLDLRSFRLSQIGFGDTVIDIPENRSVHQERITLESGMLLDIDAGIDITTGEVKWVLRTIDPATGQAPIDPSLGFLPPNDENHAGEGFVSFTVKPKAGLDDGTKITNQATIVFDVNEAIDTNVVTNTIQRILPDLTPTALVVASDQPTVTDDLTLTLTATVQNISDVDADEFTIRFFNGTPDKGTEIGTATLSSLSSKATETVEVRWVPPRLRGEHEFSVKVDADNAIAELNETNNVASSILGLDLAGDINGDEIVDITDLVLVGSNFGVTNPEDPRLDINGDGVINIFDLVLLSNDFGQSNVALAPAAVNLAQTMKLLDTGYKRIRQAINGLESVANKSHGATLALEALRAFLTASEPPVTQTKLLANYPNPFNPETWIPYQLAKEADVTIEIYNILGQRVRKIDLGFQPTGYYITKEKAAYWDGRNETGERIASGVYFYHIRAGKYSETRKMLVVK